MPTVGGSSTTATAAPSARRATAHASSVRGEGESESTGHRSTVLADERGRRALRVNPRGVMGFGHGVHARRRASRSTPRWSAPPPRPSIGLDFDGTLAPIVEDPPRRHIHPDAGQVLVDLAAAGARGRGDHRPAGAPGARPRRARGGRQRDRRRRQGAVPLRPVRQRALELHQPPGHRAAAAARAGDVPARAAPAAAPGRRRGRLRRGEGAGGRRPHPAAARTPSAPFERLLPAARASSRAQPRPGRRARPAGDRGALARHAQGHGGRAARRGARTPAASSSSATTSATWRPSRRWPRWARHGLPTLLVCSASDEESALVPLSDVVVHGPDGVLDLLRQLTADAAALTSLSWVVRTVGSSLRRRGPPFVRVSRPASAHSERRNRARRRKLSRYDSTLAPGAVPVRPRRAARAWSCRSRSTRPPRPRSTRPAPAATAELLLAPRLEDRYASYGVVATSSGSAGCCGGGAGRGAAGRAPRPASAAA